MTSPDLSIPDLESEAKTQDEPTEEKQEVKVDQKRMKIIQLAEIGEIKRFGS